MLQKSPKKKYMSIFKSKAMPKISKISGKHGSFFWYQWKLTNNVQSHHMLQTQNSNRAIEKTYRNRSLTLKSNV